MAALSAPDFIDPSPTGGMTMAKQSKYKPAAKAAAKPVAKSAAAKKTASPRTGKTAAPALKTDAEQRHRMIAVAAYYIAERRGFGGGDTLQDWLLAEIEIDHRLPV